MIKGLKIIAIVALAALVGIQFLPAKRNQSDIVPASDFIASYNTPKEVENILRTSCYDCHSNNTAYPWYNNVAPFSYWIADHVKEGKEHLNFSKWDTYSIDKKDRLLEEIEEVVVNGEMPLNVYTYLHDDAELSESEVDDIVEWAKQSRIIYQLGKQPN